MIGNFVDLCTSVYGVTDEVYQRAVAPDDTVVFTSSSRSVPPTSNDNMSKPAPSPSSADTHFTFFERSGRPAPFIATAPGFVLY